MKTGILIVLAMALASCSQPEPGKMVITGCRSAPLLAERQCVDHPDSPACHADTASPVRRGCP